MKKKNKIQELEDQLKRSVADYQNLERRVGEQRRELILGAGRDIITKLLPVLDTLKLAQKHVQDQGLELSIKQFEDVLRQEGAEKIETEGQEFDPNTMECIKTEPGEEGKVLQETRAGYIMQGKVLRPAQVVVGNSA